MTESHSDSGIDTHSMSDLAWQQALGFEDKQRLPPGMLQKRNPFAVARFKPKQTVEVEDKQEDAGAAEIPKKSSATTHTAPSHSHGICL